MSTLLGTYSLEDRRTGKEVEATLWHALEERHAKDFAEKWKPAFQARFEELKAAGGSLPEAIAGANLQDAHWRWEEKVAARQDDLSWVSFAVEAEGVTQGLMFTHMGPLVRAREPSQRDQYLVDIDLLATAPWNRFGLVPKPQFKGVGQLLLAAAVSLSFSEEFAGRIGLHALPQAESWYRDQCGMTDLGVDDTKMRYFEMTEAQARAFLK
jgi:GNAT superfamily N-acetyltransferase